MSNLSAQKCSLFLRNVSSSTCSVKVITQSWISLWLYEQLSIRGKCFLLKLLWNFFLDFKFMMNTFMIVSHITKLDFGTTSVMFPILITFYSICFVFGISIKWFVNVINFIRNSLLKYWSFFHQLTQLTRRPFLPVWTRTAWFIYLR